MSPRLQSLAAAVFLILALDAHAGYSRTQDFRPATPQELAMKGVDSMPGAAAAILDWVRIDDDQNSFSADYYRIKVFTDEGKKWADVEVPYLRGYPYFGRVSEIEARTIRPDGTVVPFDGKVYDKVVVKTRGLKVHAKTFHLADVQPGSILEYRYVRRWSQSVLMGTSWSIQHDIPLLHAKLMLKPYDSKGEYSTFFTYSGLPAGKAPVRVPSGGFELELQDIPAFQYEPYSPPEPQLRAYVNFHYTTSRLRPEQFWPSQATMWSKTVEDFIGKPDAVRKVAVTLSGSGDRDTANAIYAYVQKLRNYSFESPKTEQELSTQSIKAARNAADVLKNGAGFGDELNRTWVALARAAGLQANVMRVAPRNSFFFSKEILDGEQLSGEIAVVTLDGKQITLDPGTPGAPFGIVSWEKTNTPGILIARGAEPQWTVSRDLDPKDALIRRVADLKVSDDTLTGKVVVTFSGQQALRHRLGSIGDEEAARRKELEEQVRAWFADGSSVTLQSLTGIDAYDQPVVATFDVTLPNLVSTAGTRTLVPLSVFETRAPNPFAPGTRRNAIYFEHPQTTEDEVTIAIPETLRVFAVPPPSNLDGGALGYRNEATASGTAVTYKRSMFIDAMLVDAKNYGALRNFYSAVKTADEKPLVLVAKE